MYYEYKTYIMALGIVCFCVETICLVIARKRKLNLDFWPFSMYINMNEKVFYVVRVMMVISMIRYVVLWNGSRSQDSFYSFYSVFTMGTTFGIIRSLRKGYVD